MTTMKHFSTNRPVKLHPDQSNFKFIVGATIISIVLVLLSIAFQVGIDPDVAMLVSP